jgi:sulfotransferase
MRQSRRHVERIAVSNHRFSDAADALIAIDYDKFVRNPTNMIATLYAELQEPVFPHDFENLDYDAPDYDATLGMPGLHEVRARVAPQVREPCIPPDIFATYADTNFWSHPEMNRRGVVVL